MTDFYISVDIESFGPIPGPNSMVNLGAVAYTADKRKLGEFDGNLQEIEGSVRDPDTMDNFWLKPAQAETLKIITTDPLPAIDVMRNFRAWVDEMTVAAREATGDAGVGPVLVAYPSGFDFLYIYWYWMRYLGEHPSFWFKCIDIKTYAAGKFNVPYNMCNKSAKRGGVLVEYWPKDKPHTHLGVDDAYEQLLVFFNVRDGIKPE